MGERFSLSPRERVGVRGKDTPLLRRARILQRSKKKLPTLPQTHRRPWPHPTGVVFANPLIGRQCRPRLFAVLLIVHPVPRQGVHSPARCTVKICVLIPT